MYTTKIITAFAKVRAAFNAFVGQGWVHSLTYSSHRDLKKMVNTLQMTPRMHFFGQKCFDLNFTKVNFSHGTKWLVNNGSGNGYAPNRRQAITLTSVDSFHYRVYAPPGSVQQYSRFMMHKKDYCRGFLFAVFSLHVVSWLSVYKSP